MSEAKIINGELACSVCLGTGKPPQGDKCICLGEGTHKAEVDGLRSACQSQRVELNWIMTKLNSMGYDVKLPSQIVPAIIRLHKRCTDAEEEYVKLKRQRVT